MPRQGPSAALLLVVAAFACALPARAADEPAAAESAADIELRASLRGLVESGDFASALRAADRALTARPACVPALEYRAMALQRLRFGDAARAAYRALLCVRPDHAWALTQLGALCGAAGDLVEAENLLRRATVIDPKSCDARRKLSSVQRAQRNYAGAEETLRAALAAGDDAVWCHAQIAYCQWARRDAEAAHASLGRANAAGAPTDDVERVERLLRWDADSAPDPRQGPVAPSGPWFVTRAGVIVQSGLGPRLPAEIASLLDEVPARHRAWLGLDAAVVPVVVALYRTFEDHDDVRRFRFPQSTPGRAFLDRVVGPDGRPHQWLIHVCSASDHVATSLSHELAHAALYDFFPQAPPPWLDEGLATYLETPPDGSAPRGPRPEFESVVRTCLAEERALPWRSLFAADRTEFDGPDARLRYAQAWSVVRFLVERVTAPRSGDAVESAAAESARKARLSSFLRAASTSRNNGETLRAIGEAAGGDLAELERAWAESAK